MKIVEIPAEECMFALLTKPAASGREQRQELVYAFEALIPIPLDHVHMVFASIESGVLACACSKSSLEPVRAHAELAIPAALPGWLSQSDSHALRHRLNLLNGSMQSGVRFRRRRLTSKVACTVMVLSAAMIFLGARQRAGAYGDLSEGVRVDINAMYSAALPRAAAGSTQPDAIRFATLMNQLSATRTGADISSSQPAVPMLAEVLERWSENVDAQLRSLSVDQAGIRIEVSVSDNERGTEMLERLQSDGVFSVVSHQMTPSSDRVELRIQLERNETAESQYAG